MTELLGRPTNNSMTINVLFDIQVEAYFEYGTVKGNYTLQTSVFNSVIGQPIETKFENLLPATRYFYRTRYRKKGQTTYLASDEHTFITQRKKGSTFCFTVESDPHPYDKKGCWQLWDICLANQLKDTADFMIDMGDTFGDDHNPLTITSSNVQQLQLNCRNFLGKVCHSLPFFFCIGNHEGESGYYLLQTPPNNLAMYETTWRKLYYPNPYPDDFYSGSNTMEGNGVGQAENYYAWEWGDAIFVILDLYRYASATEKPQRWDFTIGKTQYDWFKQTLEKSTAKHKFVFAHHVLGQGRGGIELANDFEWGGNDAGKYIFDSKRPGWGLPLHQLMQKNKVDIFFQGHDHIYVKQDLDSVVYQSVPMPSDSSYKIGVTDNGSAYLSGTQLDGSGHLRVTVSDNKITVDYVRAILPKHETSDKKNRDVVFTYFINKSAGFNTVDNEFNWSVFPNPTTNDINIMLNHFSETELIIELFNIQGQILNRINLMNIDNNMPLNLKMTDNYGNQLHSGIYFIRLLGKNRNLGTKQLIIE
jgi:hypothetical protein